MEFYKVKKLLNKDPKTLREDTLLSLDYLRIINLLKKKKLMENTSNHYDVEDSLESVYLDADATQKMLDEKERLRRERKDRQIGAEEQASAAAMAGDLSLKEDTTDASVKAAKKAELKDAQKLLQQFEKLSSNYQKGN